MSGWAISPIQGGFSCTPLPAIGGPVHAVSAAEVKTQLALSSRLDAARLLLNVNKISAK
jgi:hypothetical protein